MSSVFESIAETSRSPRKEQPPVSMRGALTPTTSPERVKNLLLAALFTTCPLSSRMRRIVGLNTFYLPDKTQAHKRRAAWN